jgi:hypothetical protein
MNSGIKNIGVVRLEPLAPPKLLSAMVAANQTFYKNDRPDSWLSAYTERAASHASL